MTDRRQEYPYSVITTVSGYVEEADIPTLSGEWFIVKPPGTGLFLERDNQLARRNLDSPLGFDFFPPIKFWPVITQAVAGFNANQGPIYMLWTGDHWYVTPDPDVTTLYQGGSLYLIQAGQTVIVPEFRNLLWNHDLTNHGVLINHGRVVSV